MAQTNETSDISLSTVHNTEASTTEQPSLTSRRPPPPSSSAPNASSPTSPPIPSPPTPTPHLRLTSIILAFFTAGLNDGSLGALLPYILRYYSLSTTSAIYLYISSFLGWAIIAVVNNHVVSYLGLAGALFLGSLLQVAAPAMRGWAPPFAVLAASFGVVTLGQALQDSSGNSFVAGMGATAHRWLGAIHASYGVGGMVGGLVSAAIARQGNGEDQWWARFYWVALGVGVANSMLVWWAFEIGRKQAGRDTERNDEAPEERPATTRTKSAWKELQRALRTKAVWVISLFFFFYLGAGITLIGWMVEFLVTVRDAPLNNISFVSSGMWAGMAAGRLVLAEPTHKYGEKKMILLYSALALALQIVIWCTESAIVDSVMAILMNFVLGPFFPAGISTATRLLSPSVHAPALGLMFVVAQAGGSLFPALTGGIAGTAGVNVLPPILIGLLAAMTAAWGLVAKIEHRSE